MLSPILIIIIYMLYFKFKQVYIKIVNKHKELNEKVNQQLQDTKQVKT